MSETTLIDKENTEATPYQNAYRKDLAIDDDETESLDLDEVQGASKATSSLIQNEEQEHDWKKRYSDLKRYHDTKQNEWKQEQQLSEAKFAAQQRVPTELPKTQEELETFRDEYPEIFSVMQSVSQLEANSRVSELETQIEYLQENEEKVKEQVAEQELLVRHPDFFELKESQEFLDWLILQPENISDGLYKNKKDVSWASRVVDLYKLETGHSQSKPKSRTRQDAAAAVTKTRSTPANQVSDNKRIWTSSEISKLKPHEFEALEKELDLASRQGRII
ncbi:MAG TPA: hypothetical protein EYQ21_04565 [Flavobacteriales bacterium]|nr:hypothetical protein [Flavobacteriales bacterium]